MNTKNTNIDKLSLIVTYICLNCKNKNILTIEEISSSKINCKICKCKILKKIKRKNIYTEYLCR